MLTVTSTDRILILAPHPDDESIGTGGLLLRARAVGATARVVFGTSGDNNAWPQRAIERRLFIPPSARSRWAARRREEARAALRFLYGTDSPVLFLNLPDQGVTRVLLHGGEQVIAGLRAEIAAFRPTMIALPSADDAHPDHSALHVLSRFALREPPPDCRVLCYLVHRRGHPAPAPESELRLTSNEVRDKRRAILCHETQMALSRRRFTSYAKPGELFTGLPPARDRADDHPVVEMGFDRGALRIVLRPGKRIGRKRRLLIAVQSVPLGMVRWSVLLPARNQCVDMRDEMNDGLLRRCSVRVRGPLVEVRIPSEALHPIESAFVKLTSRRLFFDSSGWREIPLAGRAVASVPRGAKTAN